MSIARAPRLFVSQPIAMSSAAGWYVGRICREEGLDFSEPYDRETDYVATEDDAKKLLAKMYPNGGRSAPDLAPGLPEDVAKALARYEEGCLYPSTTKENAAVATTLGRYLRKRIVESSMIHLRASGKRILEFTVRADPTLLKELGEFEAQDGRELAFCYKGGEADAIRMLPVFAGACIEIRNLERNLVATKTPDDPKAEPELEISTRAVVRPA